jgi:hypothetical protein
MWVVSKKGNHLMTLAKPTLLALAVLAFAPSASHAALMSGQDLVAACSGDATGKAICDGYLMAVTDAVLQRESRGRTGGKACVPSTVTIDQVRQAVVGVSSRPRAMSAPAGVGVVAAALRMTWPCDGAQPDRRRGNGQGFGGQGFNGAPPYGAPPAR